MHIRFKISLIAFAFVIFSCSNSGSRPTVDVTIENASTNHLDWVRVEWGGAWLTAGVLGPSAFGKQYEVDLPNVTTNVAFVVFINEDDPRLKFESGSNEEVRARREKSWIRLPVDVSRLQQLRPGNYDVKFRIFNLTNASLVIE